MNRSALLLCVAALAGACCACTQGQQPQSGRVNALGACNATNFINSIQILKAGYTVDSASYTPPDANVQQGVPLKSISSQAAKDLTDAFNNAPKYFQRYLCSLDGVYISPAGTSWNGSPPVGFDVSWGYRSWTQNASDIGSKYIAISGALWPSSTGNAIPFSQYEYAILTYYAPWSPGPTEQQHLATGAS